MLLLWVSLFWPVNTWSCLFLWNSCPESHLSKGLYAFDLVSCLCWPYCLEFLILDFNSWIYALLANLTLIFFRTTPQWLVWLEGLRKKSHNPVAMNTLHLKPLSSSLRASGWEVGFGVCMSCPHSPRSLLRSVHNFGSLCPWEELDSLRNGLIKWMTSILDPPMFKHSLF